MARKKSTRSKVTSRSTRSTRLAKKKTAKRKTASRKKSPRKKSPGKKKTKKKRTIRGAGGSRAKAERPKQTSDNVAKRDSLDFRDWIYQPALIALPPVRLPQFKLDVLDQGAEGACTGFGLAAVINYLLRAREGDPKGPVSPRMLYEMAKRHDRWPGHSYEGSTARGAIKGWFKNGVCLKKDWEYDTDEAGEMSMDARKSSLDFPLGSFYRILPRRSDVHAALLEAHVVFATAATHTGWEWLDRRDGTIEYEDDYEEEGGHAFAIIGYCEKGFLIQNSWGKHWGGARIRDENGRKRTFGGCAIWKYRDFDRNAWDLWVARLARPVESIDALSGTSGRRETYAQGERPSGKAPPRATIEDHFIHIDDGGFDPHGDYWSTEADAKRLVQEAVTSDAKHLLIYAHGGLNSVKDCGARVAAWRPVFAANGIHEIHLIWETGLLAEMRDILLGKQKFVERRAGGFTDWTDRWVERATGGLGRGLWREMTSDAEMAFVEESAGSKILEAMIEALQGQAPRKRPAIHLVGHSAGSILHGHLLERWRRLSGPATAAFRNLVLFAPACTHELFASKYKPALADGDVKAMHHFLLDDKREKDDSVAGVYRKSLLYLVSRAYQKKKAEVPILGMESSLKTLNTRGVGVKITNYTPRDNPNDTASDTHGGFDNDVATMNSMLRIVLNRRVKMRFGPEHLTGY